MSKKISGLFLTIKANNKILQTKINNLVVSKESTETILHELEQHISNINNITVALNSIKTTEPVSQVERTAKELKTYRSLTSKYITELLKVVVGLQDKVENDISTFANLKNEAFARMASQGDEPQFEDHRLMTRIFKSFSKESSELQAFIDALEKMYSELNNQQTQSELGA